MNMKLGNFIPRDFNRVSEADDFTLNVADRIDTFEEAVEVFDTCESEGAPPSGALLGWKIQSRYE